MGKVTTRDILDTLYRHSGLKFDQLCDQLKWDRFDSRMDVFNAMYVLARSGLIAVNGVDQNDRSISLLLYNYQHEEVFNSLIFSVSKKYMEIADSLNFEIEGSKRSEKQEIHCFPLFGLPIQLAKRADIFVIMPFNIEMDKIYNNILTPLVKKMKISIMRADDIYSHRSVMSDVWSGIFGAYAVIADCTGKNANVFYEMGIAHTLGKPVVIITQDADDIPADIRHMKYIKYKKGDRNIPGLLEAIKTILFDYQASSERWPKFQI